MDSINADEEWAISSFSLKSKGKRKSGVSVSKNICWDEELANFDKISRTSGIFQEDIE